MGKMLVLLASSLLVLAAGCLKDGVPASSGEGRPARNFPVDQPLGLACDPAGNLFVSSTRTIRALPANENHIIDGTGLVRTVFGQGDRNTFPLSESNCLTAITIAAPTTTTPSATGDATAIRIADACSGLLLELTRADQP
jgi:hypothetical protein